MLRLKVCLFCFLFVNVVIPAWGQSFPSVLTKLDQNYYYPQNQGVRGVSAQVQWEQLDVDSGSGKFLRKPDLKFTWRANFDNGLGNFTLAKGQSDSSQDWAQEIAPFRELIVPLTLKQKFTGFEGRVNKLKKNSIVVKLSPRSGLDLSYSLMVDAKRWVINKLRFQQSRAPEKVEADLRYLKLGTMQAIFESRTQFEVSGEKYKETTRFTYKKVKGIWWVHRIDQTLKIEDHVLRTYVVKLSNFLPVFQ